MGVREGNRIALTPELIESFLVVLAYAGKPTTKTLRQLDGGFGAIAIILRINKHGASCIAAENDVPSKVTVNNECAVTGATAPPCGAEEASFVRSNDNKQGNRR
ncbi:MULTISPECIES: hypothetical protein [Mesorhizobium]|uniref:hypothetical protein n=1 Tax=Mesorhizobium TaxID=68287 RepID=UPI0013156147|nr:MULTISPECIES: hypothetical protein [Mesorhizobium]